MRTGQTTNGHLCGVFTATDPDEGRTRGTHSLAGNLAALELIGHAPRRSKPVVINACRHAAVEFLSWSCKLVDGLPEQLFSSGRQHKGLAAMATTAFQ